MAHIESWKNNKTLLKQEDFGKLNANQKEGKYYLGKIESYFALFESLPAPKSNPLLAVKELYFAKQGSMNSGEFHSHITRSVASLGQRTLYFGPRLPMMFNNL